MKVLKIYEYDCSSFELLDVHVIKCKNEEEVFEKIKQHYYLLEDENNNTDLSFDEYWSKNNLETIEYYSNYEYEII